MSLALRDWRQAAIGAKAQPLTTATPMAVATGDLARDPAPARAPEPKLPKHGENPMWATYDQIVDATFKTGFQRYMWGVAKRYGQFILDNADPDVPGRSPIELSRKLVEALKRHPVQAEAVILSHQSGREVPQPGQPLRAGRTNVIRVEGGTPAPVADAPVVFKQPGRIPRPDPGRVEPFPYELTPLDPVPAKTPAKPAPADIHTPELPEPILRETDPIPYKKDSEKRRKRRRGILQAKSRSWEF